MAKKRRKKIAYIPYDYEEAFEKQAARLREWELEQIITRGRKKCFYATKEITSGDRLEVEIYPEFRKSQAHELSETARRGRNRRAMQNLNDKNSRKALERLINTNFSDRDIWATFTYEETPATIEEAERDIALYIKRVNYRRKKKGLGNMKYVYVTAWEPSGDGVRCHHHLVTDGELSMDELESLWKKGQRNELRRLHRDEDGLSGLSNYIGRQPRPKGVRKWRASLGLKKPVEKKNHYKFQRRDVLKMVRRRAELEARLDKWYGKTHLMRHAEVRYNEVNGQFYIYARLKRKD